jgi:hypothetical protein
MSAFSLLTDLVHPDVRFQGESGPDREPFRTSAVSQKPPFMSRSGRAFHMTGATEINRHPAALHNTQQRKVNKIIVANRLTDK